MAHGSDDDNAPMKRRVNRNLALLARRKWKSHLQVGVQARHVAGAAARAHGFEDVGISDDHFDLFLVPRLTLAWAGLPASLGNPVAVQRLKLIVRQRLTFDQQKGTKDSYMNL